MEEKILSECNIANRVERNESEEESGSNYEGGNVSDDSDGEDWANENLVKKQSLLERRSNKTHPVHCPYYAGEKFEWWWLFLIDKKLRRLVVPGVHCTTLVDEQTVSFSFYLPIRLFKSFVSLTSLFNRFANR